MARQMKDSGIAWIGEIPEKWSLRRLRFLCDISTGNQDTQDNDPDGEYPFYVRSPIVEKSRRYTFEGPAILMAGDGVGAGKVFHYVDGKYGCHQRVYSMQHIHDIHRRFLFYYLQNRFVISIETANSKSTVDSVRLPMLQDFPVTIPSPAEQQRIASFLDRKCAEIDAVIERTKATIEEYKKLKQAVITEAVTKGVRGPRHMKDSGIEWIGKIPEEWEVCRKLSYRCKSGISYGIVKLFDPDDENGVKVLRCSDVYPGGVSLENVRTVTQEVSNEYRRTILKGGEVIIAVRGSLGGCAVVTPELVGYNVAREVAVIPLDDDVYNKYVMYYLLSEPFMDYRDSHLLGSVYVGLNIELLSACPIIEPVYSEQIEIVEYLDRQCAALDALIAKKTALLAELESYKKSLIYEYVTGKKEVPACP